MLQIQYFAPSPLPEAARFGLAENFSAPTRRRRLRLYIVGDPDDAQHAIDYLHLHSCIDRIEWSHEIAVPHGGVVIRRDPGDVLRYLQRYRRLG